MVQESKKTMIAFSEEYILQLPEKHPFPIQKYKLIPEKLLEDNVIKLDNFFAPQKIDLSIVELTHSKDYINRLINLELSYQEIRKIGFPLSKELIDRELIITQGTLDCCFFAMKNDISFNIAGGTHHAYRDSGSGFCILNDIAVATNYLLKNSYVQKVLIVDLDVHQGNGNAKIFEHNENVFTFSMHGEKNFPLKKEVSNLDIPLPDKTSDKIYLELLKENLPKIINEFNPDFIFYISGVDILEGDKFGRISVSKEGCQLRDRYVFETAKKYNLPVTVVMGGGYSKDINQIVDAHCNTYKVAKSIFQ